MLSASASSHFLAGCAPMPKKSKRWKKLEVSELRTKRALPLLILKSSLGHSPTAVSTVPVIRYGESERDQD